MLVALDTPKPNSSCISLAIFGSTGSIGKSCLDIVRGDSERFGVVSLVANANIEALLPQVREFRPRNVGIASQDAAASHPELISEMKSLGVSVHVGEEECALLAGDADVTTVLAAVVGSAGLRSVLSAIDAGKIVALANKESLVCGGQIVLEHLKRSKSRIIPVDSEHSAIFQSILGQRVDDINSLILTASGGPFLNTPLDALASVTPEMALKHPRWTMGPKVTIDSSTLFNKALEMIEAHWLFGIESSRIEVLIHPQSIVHSLVSFCDGTVISQSSHPDMRGPIAFALSYPGSRVKGAVRQLDLAAIGSLEFRVVDGKKFPAIDIARQCLEAGNGASAVLNCANEVAVRRFLAREIPYLAIASLIQEALSEFSGVSAASLEELEELNQKVSTWTQNKKSW